MFDWRHMHSIKNSNVMLIMIIVMYKNDIAVQFNYLRHCSMSPGRHQQLWTFSLSTDLAIPVIYNVRSNHTSLSLIQMSPETAWLTSGSLGGGGAQTRMLQSLPPL